ncbi:MAG: T9SS type A sorting domain-containing protein [Chitinophagaceae bacterium]
MKKIKHFLLSTSFLALSYIAIAQTPRAIEWQKSFGGDGPDIAYGGQQTSDGGYIFGGFSGNNNGDITGTLANTNYWVVKTNSAGTIQWQKTLGSNGGDQGLSIVQTTDGGYIVVGETNQSGSSGNVVGGHGGLDVLVVKLSSTGATQWSKTLGGTGDERATSVIQTADGGYAFTGLASSNNGDVTNIHNSVDYWVVKLNSTGDLTWQKTYGGSGDDRAYSIKQTTDGGYIVTGESNTNNDGDVTGNHGNIDMWVIKINSTGTLQWQKSFGGSNQERGRSIIQTTDGGYIVAGSTNSSNSGDITGNRSETITQCYGDPGDPWYFCDTYDQDFNDYWVVKLTSAGSIDWQKYYGGNLNDEAYCIIQTKDRGYAISGYAESNDGSVNGIHGSYDAWIIKTDNSGNVQWQKAYGGSRVEYGNSISETSDEGYIVTGTTAYGVDGDVTFNHGDWDWWVFKLKGTAKSTTNFSICAGALPYSWNGLTFNTAGTQTKYFGTDSIATLNLTIGQPAIIGANGVCAGDSVTLTNPQSGGVWYTQQTSQANIDPSTGVLTAKSAGNVIVQYSTPGCGIATKTITVNPIPAVPTVAYAPGTNIGSVRSGNDFCNNKTFTIVGNPSGGVWSKTGVVSVTSPAGVVTTGNVLGAGTLTYTYTNINGCSNSRTFVSNVVSCAARMSNITDQLATSNDFTIYPNPARSQLTIYQSQLTSTGNIVITDLYGKRIKTLPLSMGTNIINVSNLSKGMYFVSTITNEGKTTKKLVVE